MSLLIHILSTRLKALALSGLFSLFFLANRAFAAQGGATSPSPAPDGEFLPNPLKHGSIVDLLKAVWGYLFAISIPLVAIMVIIGAFQIMFAAGDVEKVQKGKRTVLGAVIGFAIVLLAGGVVAVVGELLGVKVSG